MLAIFRGKAAAIYTYARVKDRAALLAALKEERRSALRALRDTERMKAAARRAVRMLAGAVKPCRPRGGTGRPLRQATRLSR